MTAGSPIDPAITRGLQLFARYAYAPNELGFCGPQDHQTLFEYATTGTVDRGLAQFARAFPGPWPYLTLMAGSAGLDDPFDERLVEAYWIGNELLDRVAMADFGRMLEQWFRPHAGRHWSGLAETVPAGALANHCFHVFGVYPWMSLLQSGRATTEPVRQMDRCRIRWGEVLAIESDEVTVRCRPLAFDGHDLYLADAAVESVTRGIRGASFVRDLEPGDWVSMHWHWVCERLDARQLANLRRVTAVHLDLVNRRVDHSGPGKAMSG